MRATLFIDGDDTLWQNAIYFERAIADFISYLGHSTRTPAEVRSVLDMIEAQQGYGSANFTRSLHRCFTQLPERDVHEQDRAHLDALGRQVADHPLELLPGVAETLSALAPWYTLVLLTKGALDEQRVKVAASGLADVFHQVVIVPEKDAATYTTLTQLFRLDPARTWMIGNAPRTDINPALAVGLNATYIPHPHTWVLEQEEVERPADPHRLQILRSFSDLCTQFLEIRQQKPQSTTEEILRQRIAVSGVPVRGREETGGTRLG